MSNDKTATTGLSMSNLPILPDLPFVASIPTITSLPDNSTIPILESEMQAAAEELLDNEPICKRYKSIMRGPGRRGAIKGPSLNYQIHSINGKSMVTNTDRVYENHFFVKPHYLTVDLVCSKKNDNGIFSIIVIDENNLQQEYQSNFLRKDAYHGMLLVCLLPH